ncbi:hypothetical protein [Nonomuraea sp. NPDC050540]|uniref:hypothetical protein n=1 Tax=Nonomuraea sp. NPDC050540 TaxID=3364367 RepID=UPI003795D717
MSGHPTTGEPTPGDSPIPVTPTPVTPTPPAREEALSVEAVIAQARQTQRRSIDGIARKLHRGQQPTAEQLYEMLHAQTLGTWWALVERKIRDAGGDQGQALARFLPLISFCLEEDDSTPDVSLSVGIMTPDVDHEFTFIHLYRAMDLIRRQAARTFLEQAMSLAPTCPEPEQAPSGSAGRGRHE